VKPVVIVQHEPSVPPGVIADVLQVEARGHVVVEAWRDVEWPVAQEIGALVVMGGTMNVDQLDDYPFLKRSRALMAEAMEIGRPTLGVCLGSQMMARVLGAEVRRASPRNALFSPLEVTAEGRGDPVIAPFADVEVLQFHEDTFDIPDGSVPLATSATSGLPQAFRYGDHAYAIQFHFEVDRSIVERWLRNIGRQAMLHDWGIADEDFLRLADAHLARQRVAGAELTRRFFALAIGR